MVGARGWKADYALIVTWERMTYGGFFFKKIFLI